MPRRNRRAQRKSRKPRDYESHTTRPVSTEAMAFELVRNGRASRAALGWLSERHAATLGRAGIENVREER